MRINTWQFIHWSGDESCKDILAYIITKQKWQQKKTSKIFLKNFVLQRGSSRNSKQNNICKLLVILFIRNSFKEYLNIVKQNYVAFFVFDGTAASFFSKKNCSSITGTKREGILVWSGGE
jgi:hypothetical protein